MTRSRFRETCLLFLSAVLLVLPLHWGGFGILAFVAFVPAFFCLQDKTSFQAFQRFFIFGGVYYAFLGYWLNYVNVLGFVLLVLYLALYFGVFAIQARAFLVSSKLRNALFVASWWVMMEYVRGFLFSGFPWALLGYSQWKNTGVIQMADLTGAYGVSFFVLWVNVIVFQLLRALLTGVTLSTVAVLKRQGAALVLVFTVVLGYGFTQLALRRGFYREDRPKAELAVSVLQGNIPQDQKWDKRVKSIIFQKYKSLTRMAAMEKPDLIVWPETSFPGYLEDELELSPQLRSLARQSRTSVLIGAPTIGDSENDLNFYNSAILYGADGEEEKRYHKAHLVPFGEYIPFEEWIGFIRNFVVIGRFNAGTEPVLFSLVSRYRPIRIAAKFSVLICYEDIFPELVRERCRAGADFLVNMSNDAWFGKSTAPYQHAQASVFRAVENRVPVVRATNTGYSCFISAEGKIFSSVKTKGEEIMVSGLKTDTLVLHRGHSFYTRFGDVLFFGVLALLWMAHREKQSVYSRI